MLKSSERLSDLATGREATAPVPQHLLRQFPTYAAAERVVDRLSDRGFPVRHCSIVGTHLRTVEHVTGRLTSGGAALAGAAGGAWFGLLLGLLLGLFSNGSAWFAVLLGSTAISAAWMAALAFAAHRATRGRRDFESTRDLEAQQYAVYVDLAYADDAIRQAGLL